MWISRGRLSHLSGRVTGVCARAPSLISVLEPGQGLGDMIVDGVSRRDVVRPLSLSGPDNAPGALRLQFWRNWPRRVIGVRAVRASIVCSGGRERVVAERAQRVMRAAQHLARDRQRGAVGAESVLELEVVGVIGRAGTRGGLCRFEQRPAQNG